MSLAIVLAGAVLLLILLLVAGAVYERLAERADARRFPPLGTMIDVGASRLHVIRRGPAHGPTVVIETGAGEPCALWWPIVERVAEFASVLAYDRAGIGASGPARGTRTPLDSANELHALLVRAQVPGPYVLVAHSYGGLIARLLARDRRGEVGGLVLVDTFEEGVHFQPDVLRLYRRFRPMLAVLALAARFGVTRLVAKFSGRRESKQPDEARMDAAGRSPGFFRGMSADMRALDVYDAAMRRPGATGDLGELPLIVITHGCPFPGPFATLEKYWGAGQERLAGLSRNGELVIAKNSNHMIQHDEPDVVVAAIRRVFDAAARGAALQPGSAASA
ncbi:MAG TPA: alpha/beta hydrolase [Gammaproteobacteria bacterium]|nr:alpha/beta hydrolase [Gammaproteobacteria bacterium]